MKLKTYDAVLEEKLSEFDFWITPSLGEIREAEQFKVDLQKIINGIDGVALLSSDFRDIQLCSANNLAEKLIPVINDKGIAEAISFLESICGVLYFATGKTDNNIKCQFPVYMKSVLEKDKIPQVSSKGKLVYKDLNFWVKGSNKNGSFIEELSGNARRIVEKFLSDSCVR